ncbi:sulfotransferase domain-containing protein [Aliarcobacter skirrowii]|uniref:sulfotransferase domain-containing protein n=1 Tax=Aliarcobacter skirrowii TaxID=28200 RepID=UPI0029A89F8F|nr:sulfotransferase domain-containing protein [Aliarcobacter skirrowii]MDX4011750.1 sulfotransferase domain-containing protein [Aliarcobacter skirrowii]
MITVVNFTSLSFSGTTWINALLGANLNSIALGPPDRVLNILLEDKNDELCRIHKDECEFWNGFKQIFNKKENYYLQLALYSGKEFIIINNPIYDGEAHKQLNNENIVVKNINLVRDGRAICASYLRQHPDSDFLPIVKDWFLPSASNLYFDETDEDTLCIRYEDVLEDPKNYLKKIGDFIHLDYEENALEFWQYEQHLTAGNAGVFNTIKFFENPDSISFKDAEFIKEQINLMKNDPSNAFKSERWKDELTKLQLFIFEYYAGNVNKKWGYDSDRFTYSEMNAFLTKVNCDYNKPNQPKVEYKMAPSYQKALSCKDKLKQCLFKFVNKMKGK